MSEVAELKAFKHLNGCILIPKLDKTIEVPTVFKDVKYIFIYESTGNTRRLRPVEDTEFTTYAHEYELVDMKRG